MVKFMEPKPHEHFYLAETKDSRSLAISSSTEPTEALPFLSPSKLSNPLACPGGRFKFFLLKQKNDSDDG